jgi:putative N6-adenine-specific DNA methylase
VTVSRAGGKLEAAIARFALAPAVRGARAVDVGSSTGGFAEVLLAHGAAHVVAVDVGHGQLATALRTDARVTSMEGVDWKRLTLHEAPGPYDFFTVDVSFVAARNMLRGLAFRLRPGAAGVVLVKPQFELADRQVRGGRVDDPNLRRTALDKVRRKAESLGFTLVDHDDSPVTGASGTVEILAYLRFEGRPASLPAVRSNAPALPSPAASPSREGGGAPDTEPVPRSEPRRPGPARAEPLLAWFAVAAPGLEEVVKGEVSALPGASGVRAIPGGVEWRGALAVGYRANLWLRTATRVLVRVGDAEAREFGKLRRRLAGLRWDGYVPPGAVIALRASTTRCRLYHTGAICETAALAIADAVPGVRVAGEGEEAAVTVQLRGDNDVFTASIDTSGERLHRRGARVEIGEAPLRETLAAGLLALAPWQPEVPLYDPMCGAGTIPIEAGAIALDRAPGLERAFALDAWPLLTAGPALGPTLRDEARARVRSQLAAPIGGSDRDPALIASARRNAARANLAELLTFACADIGDAQPPPGPGLVLLNPPYGRRLGDAGTARRATRDLGRALRARFRGWRAALLVPARTDLGALAGMPVLAQHPLKNGGLPVTLVVCGVP